MTTPTITITIKDIDGEPMLDTQCMALLFGVPETDASALPTVNGNLKLPAEWMRRAADEHGKPWPTPALTPSSTACATGQNVTTTPTCTWCTSEPPRRPTSRAEGCDFKSDQADRGVGQRRGGRLRQ
jgi:hypothetical protein